MSTEQNPRIHTFETTMKKNDEFGFEVQKIHGDYEYDEISNQLDPHTHDYYFLLFVSEGDGFHFIDCEKHEASGYSVFFVTPGQCHAYDPRTIKGYAISFKADFYQLNKSIDRIYNFPFFHTTLSSPALRISKDNSRIPSLLESMHQEFTKDEFGKQSLLRSSLEILLVELSRLYGVEKIEKETIAQTDTKRIRKLECLIDSNFVEKRTVSFYADQLNLTSRHLNSIVKKGTGQSISDMITTRVLAEAKRLLLNSDDTVAEIAWKLNFSDKAYFHRVFKNKTTHTPEGFREKFLKVH
ncbi:MAG: AraC family transcriptional regulator [Marinifilaceae bacterium]